MRHLGLEDFTTPIDDFEKRQYAILGALQDRREEFSHTRLFPTLSELFELSFSLKELVENRNDLSSKMPRRLKDVDWESKELVFEQLHADSPDIERMFELSAWALPAIAELLEEGQALYEFVNDNIELDSVGIMPIYTGEGYFFVPEHRSHLLHILRYELSMLHGEGRDFQAMKTREVHNVQETTLHVDPQQLKSSLVSEHQELPNPATFMVETDLDFPYQETMLPVVKRKLLHRLAA